MRIPLLCLLLVACTSAPHRDVQVPRAQDAQERPPDKSWSETPIRPAEYTGMERTSYYVPMRDGVRLAVDVWLPTGLKPGTKLPTILEQTRYYRSSILKSDPNGACRPAGKATLTMFVTHGYAYVVVDTRGSGASFGTRSAEYSNAEIKDGAQIVDWIVRQGWSDGRVGALGQSYTGTTAEMLLRNHHPAVKAVSPTFSGYDFYSEILFPGGIRSTFAQYWSDLISELDRASTGDASPVLGPCPVDGDADRAQLRAAIAQHAGNLNVAELARQARYTDDVVQGIALDAASLWHFQKEIDAANVPLYGITGWYDSGYTLGALRRFMNSTSPHKRLLIGPWNHGARFYYGPGVRAATPSAFDMPAEKLRYFDSVLKGIDAGFSSAPPIRYFTTGSNQWHGASQWPPPESRMRAWHFADGSGLTVEPSTAGYDENVSDESADSGAGNRWRATMGPSAVFYPDRSQEDRKLLTYTSGPLTADLEVTGNPVAHVFLSTSHADADVIVYLEEVTADGQVNYVTEGELRASHRVSHRRADARKVEPGQTMDLEIVLLPMSHAFKAGNRIRIALADADRAQFIERPPQASHWQIHRSASMPSRIELPVLERR